MIDLIIPYYNNPEGLKRTLDSVDKNIFQITIVDDCSDYTPSYLSEYQVMRHNKNRGPGSARQLGIDITSNDWIVFIDTGDIFNTKGKQFFIRDLTQIWPNANIISCSYNYKDKVLNETSNRLHGKIYKRAFLKKYDITFAPEYLNEDIGFNRTCRICTEYENNSIIYIPDSVITWIEDSNSLTQKDNGKTLYKDQTGALARNAIHTIEICRKNNINAEAEINQIAIALYYWYVRTAAERPQYIEDAWKGAKIFYDYFKEEIDPSKLLLGNAYMKKCLQYRGKINFPINILRFAYEMEVDNMKEYTKPMAEKLEFNYEENVTASSNEGHINHGDMGIGLGGGGGCDHKPGHGNPHKPHP